MELALVSLCCLVRARRDEQVKRGELPPFAPIHSTASQTLHEWARAVAGSDFGLLDGQERLAQDDVCEEVQVATRGPDVAGEDGE